MSNLRPRKVVKKKKTSKKISKKISNSRSSTVTPRPKASPPFNLLYDEQVSYQLLLCLDLGTSKFEAAYGINATSNTDPFHIPVEKLPLQRQKPRMPALIGIKPSDPSSTCTTQAELIFRRDVEFAMIDGSVQPEHCFSNLKQGHYLMDPEDNTFKHLQKFLFENQRKHRTALEYLHSFDQVRVQYPRGRVEIFHKTPNPSRGEHALSTVEDVFVVLFSWTLDYVKLSLAMRSCLSADDLDEIFNSTKLRIGVAAPDILPASQVTKYYELLVRSGFGEGVEMLSEARCAAVKVSRDILKYGGNPLSLGQFGEKDIDICDIGHGTTDVSTIRAIKNGATYQFKFLFDAVGEATGGKVIEDVMIELLRHLFNKELRQSKPRDRDGVKIEEEVFLEGFRRGIADAKCDFANTDSQITLIYYGPGDLPSGHVADGFSVSRRSIGVPGHMLKKCYDEFLQPIIQTSKNQAAKTGLLQQHYNNITEVGQARKDRHIFLVGGAAISRYTQEKVQACLKKVPFTANTPIAYFGQRGEAYVAEGGVLMLSDKELCQRRFHSEALGSIVKTEQGTRVIEWFFFVGQSIDCRPQFEHWNDYEIQLEESHPLDDQIYPVMLEWQFARTSDEVVGKSDLPMADDPALSLDQGIQLAMDRTLCKFIGWTQDDASGLWKLTFNFKLHVSLVGCVVNCDITIPEGGIWQDSVHQDDAQPTKTFKMLMTANLSHLCREDEWVEPRKKT